MSRSDIGAPAPYPRAAKALALLIVFVSATAMWVNLFHPFRTDFISYWAASVLTLQGNAASVYDIEQHRAVEAQAAEFTGLMPFPYPPPFLLMILPLGLLPYPVAAATWIGATFGAYVATARRLWPQAGWLLAAFPAVLVNGIVGQNGFVTAALFIGGLSLLEKRPFAAGLLLGCLIIKPQLGVLLPIAFIAGRQWHAFAGAAFSSVALLLLGLLFFGAGSYRAMAELMPLYASIASDGLVGWHKMVSVYASLRLAGAPAQAAWVAHGVVAATALLIVWRIWRSDCELPAKGAALVAATLVVSPYLYIYDTLILVAAFFYLATAGSDRRLLAFLWCLPLLSIAQSWGFNETLNLMPVVPIMLLLETWRRRSARTDASRPYAGLSPLAQ